MSTSSMNRRKFLQVTQAGMIGAAAALMLPKSSSAAESGGNLDFSGVTLNHLTGPNFEKASRAAAEEFKQTHGATVNFTLLPTLQLKNALTIEMAAETSTYDTVNISPWWLGDFGPHLEPLDQYFSDPKVAMADFDLADFNAAMMKSYVTFDNKLIGLPSRADNMMLLYRTDLFGDPDEQKAFKAKYGTDLVVPTNWDEFNRAAEFFTRPDKGLYGHLPMGKRTQQPGAEWINRYFGLGGEYFDAKGAPMVGGEAGVKSMQLLAQVMKYAPPSAVTYDSPEVLQAFISGQGAMAETWPGTVVAAAENPAQSKIVGKYNGTVMPGGHGCGGGWFHAALTTSNNKVAAFKWVELLGTKKYVQMAWEKDGNMPARTSAYNQPYLVEKFPKGFADQFKQAFNKSINPPHLHPEDSELKETLDQYASVVMAGGSTPEQASADLQRSWTEILKRAGRV